MNNEVLLSGERGVYCEVDISPFMASSPIDLEKIEQELSSIGFQRLGNIFCSAFSGVFIHGYAQSQGVTYACLLTRLEGAYLVFASVEFYTSFAHGASLTTSIVPNLEDSVEQKIYRTSSASSEIADVYREHEQRLNVLAKEHGQPRLAESNLHALAASIDEFLVREIECD